jgi:predicted transcriptional regulator
LYSKYVRGAIVCLQIKHLEISTKFLGSDTDTTILETDGVLIELITCSHKTQRQILNNDETKLNNYN